MLERGCVQTHSAVTEDAGSMHFLTASGATKLEKKGKLLFPSAQHVNNAAIVRLERIIIVM